MKITHYAINRRLAAAAILVVLIVLGIYGYRRISVDYLPAITYPLIKLQIRWPAATPEEIDADIAEPVERIMATIDRLDYIESSALEGLYSLDVHFEYGTNIDVAFQDVLAALTRAQRGLPPDIEPPFVFKADPSQLPVMRLTVSSETWNVVELREWADNWSQDRILAVAGVAGVEIIGGLAREIRIQIDPETLEKYSFTLDSVISRISKENIDLTAGRVTVGSREIIARTIGEFTSLEDIRNIVLSDEGHKKVYLRDIADVVDSHEEARIITRFNQETCVTLSVLKQAEANTVETANAVDLALKELQPALPAGIQLDYVENQAVYVTQALAGVRNAAIAAAVLLILVIYFFLGSVRQVLVMIIALPSTLIVNFGFMKLAGFSLNIFSLGGLVVAIGVVLDNSTVVLENITRMKRKKTDQKLVVTAEEATGDVGPALVAATLSFLALFMPFLIVPGLISLLFRELIFVIAGIVVISLAVAATTTPMLAAILLGEGRSDIGTGWFERFFARITADYGKGLNRIIRRRWGVIAIFIIALAAAYALLGSLGGEFLPLIDDGRIMIKTRMATGSSLKKTDAVLRRIEKKIAEEPLIQSIFTLAGGRLQGLTILEIAAEGEINLQLIPLNERNVSTSEYVLRLRRIIGNIRVPGGKIMVRQMPIRGIPGMRQSDIILYVRGQKTDVLSGIAEQAAQTLSDLDSFQNVIVSMDISKPEFQVRMDRAKATDRGLSASEAARSLRTLITGNVVTRYRDGTEYFNVRVIVPAERLRSREDVANLPVTGSRVPPVRVRDIASVVRSYGPVEIIRNNQIKQITVEADITGANLAGAVNKLKQTFAGIDLPTGYEFDVGGQAELMTEMKETILAVLAFALFFAFVVLTVQFNSLKLPLLILGSIPFCLAGVVFGMYLVNLPLGATVIIGVLVVVAATVNDGVLLLTSAGELQKRQSYPPRKAVVEAASIRLRPRIMTSMTTMVGFLPLALNLEEGGDMLQPMAVAAIGGMMMEILVALILIPSLYVIFSRTLLSSESIGE